MLRPIICTIILIINCIFYAVYVLPRIKSLPEKIKENDGLQGQNMQLLQKEYEKYYWPSCCSMIVALAAFVFNGLEKSGAIIVLLVIVFISGILSFVLFDFYRNIMNKYQLSNNTCYANRWRFRGDEGIHFAIVVGLTIYQIVLLFLQ